MIISLIFNVTTEEHWLETACLILLLTLKSWSLTLLSHMLYSYVSNNNKKRFIQRANVRRWDSEMFMFQFFSNKQQDVCQLAIINEWELWTLWMGFSSSSFKIDSENKQSLTYIYVRTRTHKRKRNVQIKRVHLIAKFIMTQVKYDFIAAAVWIIIIISSTWT